MRKEERIFCGSFLREGEVLAYVGRIGNLKKDRGLVELRGRRIRVCKRRAQMTPVAPVAETRSTDGK